MKTRPRRPEPHPLAGVAAGDLRDRIEPAASPLALLRRLWTDFSVRSGIGVSLLIHATILTTLGCIYWSAQRAEEPNVEAVFGVPGDELTVGGPFDSAEDSPLGDLGKSFDFTPTDVVSDLGTLNAASDRMFRALEGDGDGDGGGGEGGTGRGLGAIGNVRVPDSAITKGSFTVWTEPEDPLPRQRYNIVIQVKVPKSVKQFRLRDLTGDVRGTDGYYKQIKYGATDKKGVKDGIVQLQIAIPGAVQLIKDTIRIKSDMLKEEQTIEIVF
jgi:hypothetical protein